ncbi:MAG: Hsp20/alpha crystallin family protein [Rhodocyclaceae bacterium]|nr:Hsp20/alpha crystallin family protein [Rhodocyclaceae bacterium]MBX3669047.1 Hsp20/alpha crystallin family protein [Rhodocyclaceae bacterium]
MYESLLRFPTDLAGQMDRLQRELERALGVSGVPSSIRANSANAFPSINVAATADTVEVYAMAPGIDPATLDVSIDKGLLSISGTRRGALPENGDKLTVYARERFRGPFKRVVSLPEDADPERVSASYRDGVLHIRVHKRESAKPRRIAVS